MLSNRGLKPLQTLQFQVFRQYSNDAKKQADKTAMIYVAALGIFMIGMSYVAVPLYRLFCQVGRFQHFVLVIAR